MLTPRTRSRNRWRGTSWGHEDADDAFCVNNTSAVADSQDTAIDLQVYILFLSPVVLFPLGRASKDGDPGRPYSHYDGRSCALSSWQAVARVHPVHSINA